MATGIYYRSPKFLKKITSHLKHGLNKGKHWKMSEEGKQKISKALKGKNTWSKGKKKPERTKEHRKNLSKALMGKKLSEFHKKRLSEGHADFRGDKSPRWKGGKPNCLDCGKQLPYQSKRCNPYNGKFMRGKNNPNWNGGKGTERHRLMGQIEYRIWREAVFARDNWTCQSCFVRGGKLEADHIKPWALYPELRYAIDNGRTLCVSCHRQTERWGRLKLYREDGGIYG